MFESIRSMKRTSVMDDGLLVDGPNKVGVPPNMNAMNVPSMNQDQQRSLVAIAPINGVPMEMKVVILKLKGNGRNNNPTNGNGGKKGGVKNQTRMQNIHLPLMGNIPAVPGPMPAESIGSEYGWAISRAQAASFYYQSIPPTISSSLDDATTVVGKMEDLLYVKRWHLPVFGDDKPANMTDADWALV
ncbi:hypothetical protein MRB53_029213 [Persea americana]|uniref:Uncharacterized protein n=1 Tax=Persea americana TaxID=3435 RepID=A0ACC2KIB4_PERAE|nr:hypothetical protein MRB53_029213 [Persea americana]